MGIDLWRGRDQSGNGIDMARSNARAAGVADRIEVVTADMRELPFADGSFDLIVSSLALHNLPRAGQERALDEALRVLRPGGRLLIADLRATAHYATHLRAAGLDDVSRRDLGWRLWWSGPWLATQLVRARKPPLEA